MTSVIDLRSDTVTRPTAGDARGRWPRPRSATTSTARTRRSARSRSGSPGCSATRRRCSRRPARWPTCSRSAPLVGAGQEVLCEARAHIARAELGAHAAYTGLTMRTWTAPARRRRPAGDRRRCSPPTWGRSSCRPRAVSVENTHNFAGGAVIADRGPARAAGVRRRRRRRASTSTAPGSGTRTSRPACRWRSTARSPTCWRSACPRGSVRRSARWWSARADAIAEARVWRKRMGGGMRQVGILAAAGLHALDHHVERLADDHAHARLLAEACGVDPATVDTNIVVVDRPDAAAVRRRRPGRGRAGRHGRADRGPAGHPPRRRRRRRPKRAATVLARL